MKYTPLNINWNAEPNAPETSISIDGHTVSLEFNLNYFLYPEFNETDRAQLTFRHCHKYYFGGPNDEGYFRGQHRYSNNELPFGHFYELGTDWKTDFASDAIVLQETDDTKKLKHFFFQTKEETFECVAEDYEIKLPLK